MVKLTIPGWAPSVNHSWFRSKTGKVFLTQAGKKFRSLVGFFVQQDRVKGELPKEPLTGPLQLTLTLWVPDHRKRDIDNSNKALLDALTHAKIWEDDSQVKKQIVEMKSQVVKGGRIDIEITEYQEESHE